MWNLSVLIVCFPSPKLHKSDGSTDQQQKASKKIMKDAIVLYPGPGLSHLVSMVELGKLILRHHGHKFSINILITTGLFDTPSTTSYLHRISQTYPSIKFHHFPLVSVDTSPTRSLAAVMFEFVRLNDSNVQLSLQEISKTSTICALVIDFVCASVLPIATNLRISTYCFLPSGADSLAFSLYFPTIHTQTNKSFKDLATTKFHIPGLPPLKATHMPGPVLNRDDPAYHDILYFSVNLSKSSGIIVNTFDNLEPTVIKAIADGLCVPNLPTPPLFCIGPLVAEANSRAIDDRNDSSNVSQQNFLSWLDLQPSETVVFLCFGHWGGFSAEQLKEIANGLERSGQRFLWAVRKQAADNASKQIERLSDFDIGNLMPEGFVERTKGRGMLVESWVPQVAILNHKAVGGFVTHCGWNSVLEAVVAGVPMVAWPLYAEQHLNKAVLVEDMKMAIPVERREEDGFVSGDEVERRVRELMEMEGGRELRQRSRKIREMAFAAWGELGSSTCALAKLAQVWSGN